MTPPVEENVYTVNEVARLLKVHPITIRIWLYNGTLVGIKAGRHWRIREQDIKNFYERGDSMKKGRLLRCSFCGKSEKEVAKLVAGPRVYICDACVDEAKKIMDEHPQKNP